MLNERKICEAQSIDDLLICWCPLSKRLRRSEIGCLAHQQAQYANLPASFPSLSILSPSSSIPQLCRWQLHSFSCLLCHPLLPYKLVLVVIALSSSFVRLARVNGMWTCSIQGAQRFTDAAISLAETPNLMLHWISTTRDHLHSLHNPVIHTHSE